MERVAPMINDYGFSYRSVWYVWKVMQTTAHHGDSSHDLCIAIETESRATLSNRMKAAGVGGSNQGLGSQNRGVERRTVSWPMH